MRAATPEDESLARDSHRRGTLQCKWPDLKTLRGWAKHQGWPTPWFGFEAAFVTRMLENKESFARALNESGIEVLLPKTEYTLSSEKLSELDALYDARSAGGRPTGWGMLVEELRKIRRAVEAGVVVKAEGAQAMRTWQGFYDWAHGRYHMLEDGYDHWIGDDKS